jgi:hypothetical protein
MHPVRIKYYGLFWMTKQTYFILLCLGASFMSVVLLAGAALGRLPRLRLPGEPPLVAGSGLGAWLGNNFYLVVVACLVAQVLDTIFTLRAFARAEGARWAELADLRPMLFQPPRPLAQGEGIQPGPGFQADVPVKEAPSMPGPQPEP